MGFLNKEDVRKKVSDWKPDVIGYSVMSVDWPEVKHFNDFLSEDTNIFTVIGGPHATHCPEIIADPNIDAVCVGEGEWAIVELVNKIASGQSLEGIKNIITKEYPDLVLDSLIRDLDEVPWADRELVYAYSGFEGFGIKSIFTSRGCAFSCPYCFNSHHNRIFKGKGKLFRRRSVDSIIEETKQLKADHRVAVVRIFDDVFAYRVDDWLKEFAARWPKEVNLPFLCLLRIELVNENLISILKEAGCITVFPAIDSGADEVRVKMLRRKMTSEKMEEGFRLLKKYNIKIYTNTMLGLPYTTIEQDIESVKFNIKVNPDSPNFSIFKPYSGTDLGNYCIQAGLIDTENISLDQLKVREQSVLNCFTDDEKRAQYNILQLAIFAIKFPFLENIILNKLIHGPTYKIYFILHYLYEPYLISKAIPWKRTFSEYIFMIKEMFSHVIYGYTNIRRRRQLEKSDPSKVRAQNIEILSDTYLTQNLEILSDTYLNRHPVYTDKEKAGYQDVLNAMSAKL